LLIFIYTIKTCSKLKAKEQNRIFIFKLNFSYGNCPVASTPSNKIEACSAFGLDRRKLRGCKQRVPFDSSIVSP
jgi:hypothetical protein